MNTAELAQTLANDWQRQESVLLDMGVPIEMVQQFVDKIQAGFDDPFNVDFAAGYISGIVCVITGFTEGRSWEHTTAMANATARYIAAKATVS